MTDSDLQLRAVQLLVRRNDEFRTNLLNQPGSCGSAWQFGSSVAYGTWDLIKLFKEVPRIGDEVRTMSSIASYMSAHREAEFYCQVELWASMNTVLDLLSTQRFLPTDIYGSTDKVVASLLTTLHLSTTTLSRNHVDFEYARFLLVHTARLLREASATLTDENDALAQKLELAKAPLILALTALEKNTDQAAVTACENAHAVTSLLQKSAA